jgi:hypothetical protein
VLLATSSTNCALQVQGSGALGALQATYQNPATSRTPEDSAILIDSASGASVSWITVTAASADGIAVRNSTSVSIDHNQISGTLSAGIRILTGNNSCSITHNAVTATGDPEIMVSGPMQNLTIDRNYVPTSTNNLSAIYVVSVQGGNITNNIIYNTLGYGMWLAGGRSGILDSINITGNQFQACGQGGGTGSSILVGGFNAADASIDVSNINISNNAITNQNQPNAEVIAVKSLFAAVPAQPINFLTVQNVTISYNTINGSVSNMGISTQLVKNCTIADNRIYNCGYCHIYCADGIAGQSVISQNALTNPGTLTQYFGSPVIWLGTLRGLVASPPTITNNSYLVLSNTPTDNVHAYFIESDQPGSAGDSNINGNSTNTMLGNKLAP